MVYSSKNFSGTQHGVCISGSEFVEGLGYIIEINVGFPVLFHRKLSWIFWPINLLSGACTMGFCQNTREVLLDLCFQVASVICHLSHDWDFVASVNSRPNMTIPWSYGLLVYLGGSYLLILCLHGACDLTISLYGSHRCNLYQLSLISYTALTCIILLPFCSGFKMQGVYWLLLLVILFRSITAFNYVGTLHF